MELTRRDALAALAASGVVVGTGSVAVALDDPDDFDENGETTPIAVSERETNTLTLLAETFYPAEVTGIPAFVETYVVGRVRDRPAYLHELKGALATLDEYAHEWFGNEFDALSPADREALVRQLGLDVVSSDPVGSDAERLRYYVVNELLYALFASPIGGRLVGIENPPGCPGGIASYQRGPERG